ncbi:MAG: hypothetical protein RLZZ303_2568 [Candidatus Hydrogenedentota bacterium]
MFRRHGVKYLIGFGVVLLVSSVALVVMAFQAKSVFLGPEQHYFVSDGVRIHYIDQGSGMPLLLVHGIAGNANQQWHRKGIIDKLAEDFRVIAVDCRGHGHSGKPRDPEQYGVVMAEDIVRLLDHLQLPKANIVGYSMGGFITLNLVVNHPDRIIRAGVCGAGWIETNPRNLAFAEAAAEGFEQGDARPVMQRLGLVRTSTSFLSRMGARMALTWFNDPLALAAVARASNNLNVTSEKLRHNTVPVLTIIGEGDGLLPEAKLLHDLMPHHTLIVLPGRHHLNTTTAPEFQPQLLEFLTMETTD